MLGRNSYTREELDSCKAAVQEQLASYDALVKSVGGAKREKKVDTALATFDPNLFNNLTLALDRCFVHRVRNVTGKDTNPLTEVELICDSLLGNGGVLQGNNVIRYVPEKSVLGLAVGDPIRLNRQDFGRLSTAFLAEIEAKFL